MQEPSRPVVQFLTRCQLELHEAVFVRRGIPGHNQTEKFMEREDTMRHMIDLVTYICNSSMKRLDMLSSLIMDPITKTILIDIKDENDYTIETMSLSTRELESLSQQLKYVLEGHPQATHAVVALLGTFFMPLTVIVGIVGMKISKRGSVGQELHR